MANQTWLRVYTEITRDKKLRRLSLSDRWIWITVLCMAKESPHPGYLLISEGLPITLEDIADEAGTDVESISKAIESFISLKMLEKNNDTYIVIHWDKRQFESDSSTERSRKHRENKNATLQERCGNVVATPPEAETETESDTDISADEEDVHAVAPDSVPLDAAPGSSSPDAVPEKDICVQVLDYFSEKSGVLMPDCNDIALSQELAEEIPLKIIIAGIDDSFKRHKPKHQGDKIRTLRYCEGRIRDLWEIEKAKEGKSDASSRSNNQQDNGKQKRDWSGFLYKGSSIDSGG